MRLRIEHTTHYEYPSPVRDSHNELRLMPITDDDQACLDFRVGLEPSAPVFAYDLPTGRVHHFNHRAPHDSLTIRAESFVVTHRHNPFDGLQLLNDDRRFYAHPRIRQMYAEYLMPTARVPLIPEADRIASVALKQTSGSAASFLIGLTRVLYRVCQFKPGATNVNTTLVQFLENNAGVCQDFVHLMLSVCRRQGIPSRYVSGYLYTGEKSEPEADADMQQHTRTLLGGDAMHAWVECLLPDERWHGFDPTNNLLTNDYYVKVHYGRDYGDVAPIRGLYRGPSANVMNVGVRVIKDTIEPNPEPTRGEWKR
jgi:transglutaminase-like putative cysteine protease